MAEILIKNSLGSQVAVKITVTLYESAIKGDVDEAEPKWILMVGTTHLDRFGVTISPIVLHNVIEINLDAEIEGAINIICAQVDWGPLYIDDKGPLIINYGPTGTDVGLLEDVVINVKDELPSSGLDLSNLKVTFSSVFAEYDITNEVRIKGGPFKYEIKWSPDGVVRDTYHN